MLQFVLAPVSLVSVLQILLKKREPLNYPVPDGSAGFSSRLAASQDMMTFSPPSVRYSFVPSEASGRLLTLGCLLCCEKAVSTVEQYKMKSGSVQIHGHDINHIINVYVCGKSHISKHTQTVRAGKWLKIEQDKDRWSQSCSQNT